MANIEDSFAVYRSVPDEAASAEELENTSVETDEDVFEQAVADSSIATNELRSKISKIELSDKIWTAFFENMVKITKVIKPEAGESKKAKSVQPLQLENYSFKKRVLEQVVADPDESISKVQSQEAESVDFEFEPPVTGRPRIEVVTSPEKPFTFVAQWTWDLVVDNCALCCNDINYLCVECQAGECIKPEGDLNLICICNVSQGICKHVFHSHCILRWLIRRPVCPLCGDFWMTIQCCS